jgi:hypothetical protein
MTTPGCATGYSYWALSEPFVPPFFINIGVQKCKNTTTDYTIIP